MNSINPTPIEVSGLLLSKYNTNKSITTLVDNTLQRLGQLIAGLIRHMLQLCMYALVYQLIQRLSEHIGLPDALG